MKSILEAFIHSDDVLLFPRRLTDNTVRFYLLNSKRVWMYRLLKLYHQPPQREGGGDVLLNKWTLPSREACKWDPIELLEKNFLSLPWPSDPALS
ncbi:hypothetical protein TNIN_377641 [Trichonephila inaurata madagascariensis]|uniref:Uncharacterized protein n=1 Tax=Trichonephila inaurata madagascariensis TaxID=2747483 RepID=A0A8X6YAM1_9ARAC|nr:hypothetical protein TNIN_377641 [Trichonephila inaurata madagascariensis]